MSCTVWAARYGSWSSSAFTARTTARAAAPAATAWLRQDWRGTADRECFAQKFKRHIPVIVPLWVVPLVAGVLALVQSFNGWLLGLVIVFAVNSYVVLPLLAQRHS